jgi:hypothetical protein
MALLLQVGFWCQPGLSQNTILPNTKPLNWSGDIASRLIDSCDQFLLDQIERSVEDRTAHWHRDLSSPSAYEESVQKNRDDFAKILGIKDERIDFDDPDMLGIVGKGPGYTIHQVRWPAFNQVHGEGLLVMPDHENVEMAAVVIPDADHTPEDPNILAAPPQLEPDIDCKKASPRHFLACLTTASATKNIEPPITVFVWRGKLPACS